MLEIPLNIEINLIFLYIQNSILIYRGTWKVISVNNSIKKGATEKFI